MPRVEQGRQPVTVPVVAGTQWILDQILAQHFGLGQLRVRIGRRFLASLYNFRNLSQIGFLLLFIRHARNNQRGPRNRPVIHLAATRMLQQVELRGRYRGLRRRQKGRLQSRQRIDLKCRFASRLSFFSVAECAVLLMSIAMSSP